MLIVEINNSSSIDKALKILKNKIIKTKQNEILRNKKEYTKKSIKCRSKKLKAIYKQKFKDSN